MKTKFRLSLFWKVIWSITFVLAFLGLLLWIVGSAFGGNQAALSLCRRLPESIEGSRMWENAAGSIKCSWDIDNSFPIISGRSYENMNLAQVDEVDNILIEAGGCELQIETSENDSYGITTTEILDELQCYVQDRTLYVKCGPRAWHEMSRDRIDRITLYIPAGVNLEEMEMELGAGNFTADCISAEELTIASGASNVSIGRLIAEEVSLEIGAGNTTIRDAEIGELSAEVGAGNFSLQGVINGDVDVNAGMGTVYLNLAGKESDFNYDTDCALGSIHIGTVGSMGVFAEGRTINNGAVKEMTLDCALGEIQVTFDLKD